LQLLPPLVEAGFVVRGRDVRCPRCRFRTELDLSEQQERVRCRACGQTFVFPVVDASGHNEPELTYRLDGLIARVMDQDILPVLLTVRALRPAPDQSELYFAWPGVEVKKPDDTKFDIDVLVSHGTTRVWCVETKKSASSLKTRQLSRLLRVAEELEALPGIAALEGDFPAEPAQRVREAGGVVLTGEHLFG
jgi:hypothetical protein